MILKIYINFKNNNRIYWLNEKCWWVAIHPQAVFKSGSATSIKFEGC